MTKKIKNPQPSKSTYKVKVISPTGLVANHANPKPLSEEKLRETAGWLRQACETQRKLNVATDLLNINRDIQTAMAIAEANIRRCDAELARCNDEADAIAFRMQQDRCKSAQKERWVDNKNAKRCNDIRRMYASLKPKIDAGEIQVKAAYDLIVSHMQGRYGLDRLSWSTIDRALGKKE